MIFCFRAVLAGGIISPVLPEHIRPTVWPMQLIEINIIRFQGFKRVVERNLNGFSADGSAITYIFIPLTTDFRGQNNILTAAGLFNPASNHPFCIALGFFGQRVGGVHLSGINKIDAMIQRHINLSMAFGFGVLCSPCHAAQTKGRDH